MSRKPRGFNLRRPQGHRAPTRLWRKGQPDCPECSGTGRVRRQTLKKDGTVKKLSRWETCGCVTSRTPGKVGRLRAGIVLHGAPLGEAVAYPEGVARPRTRGECQGGPRPCPWVGCRYHLFLEMVNQGRAVRLPRGLDVEPETLQPSCALDVADDGPVTLEEVAEFLGVTRERVRQVEDIALKKVHKRCPQALREAGETLSDARGRAEEDFHPWPKR